MKSYLTHPFRSAQHLHCNGGKEKSAEIYQGFPLREICRKATDGMESIKPDAAETKRQNLTISPERRKPPPHLPIEWKAVKVRRNSTVQQWSSHPTVRLDEGANL